MSETNPASGAAKLAWKIAAAVFVLTTLTGIVITLWGLPTIYTATAKIEIRNLSEPIDASLNGPSPHPSFDPQAFQAEFEAIQSPAVLLPVIQDLGLDKTWAKRLSNKDQLSASEALAHMHEILKIDQENGTNNINITVNSDQPTEAADIANAVANRYKTMLLAQQSAHDNPDIDSLQNQIQLQAQQVSAIYLKLAKIKDELTRQGIPIPPTAGGKTELELRERDLVVAKEDCAARQALLDQIKDMPDEEIANTISTLGLSDFGKDYSALQKIRGDAFDLQQQIDKLNKDGPSKDNSQLVVLRTQLDQKKQGLKATVEGIKRDMQVDLAMAKARVQMLQKEVDDMQASAGQKPNPLLEPYYATNRDLENQQNLLNALQTRLQQVETDRRLVESPVRIISRAEAPQSPSSPDRKADFVTSLVIGIVMAIGVAMLVEGLARKS